jgi:hypothetical protein
LEEGPKKDMYLVESNFGEKRMCDDGRKRGREGRILILLKLEWERETCSINAYYLSLWCEEGRSRDGNGLV